MPVIAHIVQCYKYLCLARYQQSIVKEKKKKSLPEKQKEETVQSVRQEKLVLDEDGQT